MILLLNAINPVNLLHPNLPALVCTLPDPVWKKTIMHQNVCPCSVPFSPCSWPVVLIPFATTLSSIFWIFSFNNVFLKKPRKSNPWVFWAPCVPGHTPKMDKNQWHWWKTSPKEDKMWLIHKNVLCVTLKICYHKKKNPASSEPHFRLF